MGSRYEPNILKQERARRVGSVVPEGSRARWSGQRDVRVFASQIRTGFRRAPRLHEAAGEDFVELPSSCLPCPMERATGRPRICFANPHRLQAPAGAFACSLQTLRVCFTLAPCRVRVPALGSKKHGNVTLPCLCFLLERATGLEPASVSLGS